MKKASQIFLRPLADSRSALARPTESVPDKILRETLQLAPVQEDRDAEAKVPEVPGRYLFR
ncbi:MAG: hypothetical protein IPJ55_16560 [Chloracidobacterium sp.]|nr:hypothetical protein [Chloracidobacterium sp.]